MNDQEPKALSGAEYYRAREAEMRELAAQADLPAVRAKYLAAADTWARLRTATDPRGAWAGQALTGAASVSG